VFWLNVLFIDRIEIQITIQDTMALLLGSFRILHSTNSAQPNENTPLLLMTPFECLISGARTGKLVLANEEIGLNSLTARASIPA
jgi:hypothetical protein